MYFCSFFLYNNLFLHVQTSLSLWASHKVRLICNSSQFFHAKKLRLSKMLRDDIYCEQQLYK